MGAKRLVPLLALGLTLAGVPAAHAATHATVSYSASTGFDVEDLDGQKNDIRLTIQPPFGGDAVASLVFEEVAKDSANATFPLQAGAGCSQFEENFQPQASKVICNLPQSGSRNFLLNLGGGDDHINWGLGSQGVFKNSLLHVNGGAGDDFVHISQDPTSAVAGSTWSGGDGDDDLRYSGGAPQTMQGNAGDDSVAGDAGNDTLDGGDGNDVLEGNQGQDTFKGGNGDDRFVSRGGSFVPNVTEVMDGGAGTDTIDLDQENNSLGAPLGGHAVISLDGVANDKWVVTGPPDAGGVGTTHNYQLNAIENVIGTPAVGVSPPRDGNDTITGDANANTLDGQSGNDTINAAPTSASAAFINPLSITLGPLPPPPIIQPIFTGIPPKDTLIGGPGDDELDGSQKSDVIDGGVGTDTIFGSGGGDSITTKDVTTTGNVFTDTVDCGDGTDAVTADLQDAGHLTNCENADISPGREGKHIRFDRRLRAGKGGRVKVQLHCPLGASIACNGSLALRVGRKTAGRSAHYKVARGRKRTITLKLARAFRKRTPFAAFMVASEKGRFGHKTTRLRVIVR